MNSRSHNIPALDGIRGLAIIIVMLHHFEPLIPASNTVIKFAKVTFSFGWMGVDLFFALSGFLITGILLDTRRANNYFGGFYARRVLRIFPLYYSVLTVILVAAALVHPRPKPVPLVADQKLYYLYLVNWLVLWKGQWTSNILGHFWSLAVEEQFYVVWPFCIWLLMRRNLVKLAVGASLGAFLVRIAWVAHSGPSQAIVMATVTRMDSLLCGALAAVAFRDLHVLNSFRNYLPWVAGGALSIFAVFGFALRMIRGAGGEFFFVETIGFSLLSAGFACLVLHAAVTDGAPTTLQKLFRTNVLMQFGKYSYGVYVYHVPILGMSFLALRKPLFSAVVGKLWFGVLCVILLFAVSFLTAKISYECFERKFLEMKRYFEVRRTPAPQFDGAEISA